MHVTMSNIHDVAGVSRQAWSSVPVQQRVSISVCPPAVFWSTLYFRIFSEGGIVFTASTLHLAQGKTDC